jgi:peroxiredoxin (alkyl hydroperoxide reductase subunit C)
VSAARRTVRTERAGGRLTARAPRIVPHRFVCPTEIMSFSEKAKEFEKKGVQVVGVSCDSHHVHLAWTRTPRADGGLGNQVGFPLVADISKEISRSYGVLTMDPSVGYFGAPLRAVFVIDPKGIIRSVTVNDEQVGRSTDEIMRVVEGFQYADSHAGEGCPANWKPGSATIKADADASKVFFKEWAKSKTEV